MIIIIGRKLGRGRASFSQHRPIFQITRSYFRVFFTYASWPREIWVRDYVIPTILASVAVKRLEVIGAGKNGE